MVKSKLVTILKTFTLEELKRFDKFIASPYHNTGRNLKPLLKAVTKYHPNYPADKLTDEKILKLMKISGKSNGKNTSSQLNVRFSELTKLAKNFAVIERSINNSYIYSKTLAQFYLDKNLNNLCRSEISICRKILYDDGLGEEYAPEMILLQRLNARSHYQENKREKSIKEIMHIPMYSLSYFVTNIKVQLYSNHIEYPVNYEFLKKTVDCLNIDELAELCTDDGSGLINKIKYDYKRCQFYLYENPEIYTELIEYYKKNFECLSDMIRWQYFLGLMKSGTKLMSTQDYYSYAKQLNLLIDFIFANGLFSFSRTEPLEDVLFTSIVKIKFAVENLDKLQKFADNYLHKVKPEFRVRADNYVSAFLSFMKKDFNKSLEYINAITSPTISEKNNLYKLKMAAYLELNYTEELYYLLDSYNHFMTNNTRFRNSEGQYRFSEIIKILLVNKLNKTTISKIEKEKIFNSIKTSEFEWWLKEKTQEL